MYEHEDLEHPHAGWAAQLCRFARATTDSDDFPADELEKLAAKRYVRVLSSLGEPRRFLGEDPVVSELIAVEKNKVPTTPTRPIIRAMTSASRFRSA